MPLNVWAWGKGLTCLGPKPAVGPAIKNSLVTQQELGLTKSKQRKRQNSTGSINDWRVEPCVRRLEMPISEGDDLDGWIFRVERYLRLNQISEEDKVKAAIVCFDDKGQAWYKWEEKLRPLTNWKDLKVWLLHRFRPMQGGSLCAQFLSLWQEDIVRNFCQRFETLATLLKDVSKEILESIFLNGLVPEVRAKVYLLRPVGLE